ncbi:MAG TPA: hypothetical protein VN428_04890 [Bryobacteraceae bacterium]|nr:hypothetical protein [Bryobacteraceae bacterium]
MDPTVGYRLNRYATVEAGLPFYLVKASDAGGVLGPAEGAGLGNAHLGLSLNFESPAVTYRPSLTVTAPTGNEERGFSTGYVTWDWNNLLQRTFGRVTPYASVGISNTVADSPFFVRPFTSKGLAGHFEGGALFSLTNVVGLGASGYAIVPSGNQTVISRVLKSDESAVAEPPATVVPEMPGQGQTKGRGRAKQGVFETVTETQGPAEILRDRGASLWLSIAPNRNVDFHLGYSRSVTYALNTVFFGVSFGL